MKNQKQSDHVWYANIQMKHQSGKWERSDSHVKDTGKSDVIVKHTRTHTHISTIDGQQPGNSHFTAATTTNNNNNKTINPPTEAPQSSIINKINVANSKLTKATVILHCFNTPETTPTLISQHTQTFTQKCTHTHTHAHT